jgi:hypothetical protein
MVQQVLGEAKGKCDTEGADVTATTTTASAATLGLHVNPSRVGSQGGNTKPNFPQPYYQVHAYGPGTQPILDSYFPRPPVTSSAAVEAFPTMSENMTEQVARTLREFGLE